MIALDASALLAFLFREEGYQKVALALPNSCLSTVNLAEVLGRFSRDGHDPSQLQLRLESSSIELVPFTVAAAVQAAALVPLTRPLGLSLGDRACLALAQLRGVPAMTADRSWGLLDLGVPIQLVRP